MPAIPDHIKKFMAEYAVTQDEIWPLPGGRSFAVKHSALERIAYKHQITFDPPQIIEANGAEGVATVLVTARMGDATAWTFGEASPKNNKNAYCFAMAEKRAKDRCTLKLLNTHGAIYSEDEADDFKQPEPHAAAKRALESLAGPFISALEMAQSVDDLTEWAKANKPAIMKLSDSDRDAINKAYGDHRTKLASAEYELIREEYAEQKEAAE